MASQEELLYTESHEWVEPSGEVRTVGISDHAQHMLGDIVYVEVPKVGTRLKRGDSMMTIESPKAAAEVYAPISGEIMEVNSALEAEPSLINQSPYEEGWLVKIRLSDETETEALQNFSDYQKSVEG